MGATLTAAGGGVAGGRAIVFAGDFASRALLYSGPTGVAKVTEAPSASLQPSAKLVHMVFVYDGARVRLYRNGVLTTIGDAITRPLSATTSPLTIGAEPQNAGTPFAGTVDQIAIYATALSDARVAAHFTLGR